MATLITLSSPIAVRAFRRNAGPGTQSKALTKLVNVVEAHIGENINGEVRLTIGRVYDADERCMTNINETQVVVKASNIRSRQEVIP